jgi:putative flippase GtrA
MALLKKFILFCSVGGTGVLIETLILNILLFFNASFSISKSLALFSSVSFVFFTNRRITFSANNLKINHQIPKFIIVYSLAILVNFSISLLVKIYLGGGLLESNVASFMGIICALPISFLGSNFWVFKK